MMICEPCEREITNQDDYVFQADIEKYLHLCCFVKIISFEINNNSFAFAATGKKFTAQQVFEKTLSVKCSHKLINT